MKIAISLIVGLLAVSPIADKQEIECAVQPQCAKPTPCIKICEQSKVIDFETKTFTPVEAMDATANTDVLRRSLIQTFSSHFVMRVM